MNDYDLYNKILKSANTIAKNTRSGSGNFMIINSQVAEALNGIDMQEQRKKKMKRILNDIYNSRNE